MKLLLIDDNELYLTFLRDVLSDELPVPLLIAKNIEDALEIAMKERNNLVAVVSDYEMPDGTALELYDSLNSSGMGEKPFIIFTALPGRAQDALSAARKKLQVIDKLDLPVLLDTLKQLISN